MAYWRPAAKGKGVILLPVSEPTPSTAGTVPLIVRNSDVPGMAGDLKIVYTTPETPRPLHYSPYQFLSKLPDNTL